MKYVLVLLVLLLPVASAYIQPGYVSYQAPYGYGCGNPYWMERAADEIAFVTVDAVRNRGIREPETIIRFLVDDVIQGNTPKAFDIQQEGRLDTGEGLRRNSLHWEEGDTYLLYLLEDEEDDEYRILCGELGRRSYSAEQDACTDEPVYAQHESGACRLFANSCAVPLDWEETPSCTTTVKQASANPIRVVQPTERRVSGMQLFFSYSSRTSRY